jgi:hypothetical protein
MKPTLIENVVCIHCRLPVVATTEQHAWCPSCYLEACQVMELKPEPPSPRPRKPRCGCTAWRPKWASR